MKEYPIGGELTQDEVKEKLDAGYVLITKDEQERAVSYKGKYACWSVSGKVANILMFLTDLSGWYIMERENFPRREIAMKSNTDIVALRKVYFDTGK